MTRIRLAILMTLMLAAAGCGGGSGSGALRSEADVRQTPLAVEADAETTAEADAQPSAVAKTITTKADTATDDDALAEERKQAEQAITGEEAEAARKQAAADIAARQSEEAQLVTEPGDGAKIDSFYGRRYLSAGTHAEFDGSDVRVHLPDYFLGYPVVLSSVLDETDDTTAASRVTGYSRRTWTLFDDGPLAVVSVRWNDSDDGDYLAAGWWVRDAAGSGGAFIDGPELRGSLPGSMTLPLKGRAVYYGEAAGFYETEGVVACAAFPCEIPPSNSTGEFAAEAKLVADFARGDIEGCVGCQQGIRFTPAAYDTDSGDIEREGAVTKDYLFWLHRAGFLESPYALGAFAGDLTVAPLGSRAAGYGYWEGRFSNLPDSTGSPRLLGATLHGAFEDEHAATTRFSGVLSAESTTFGESR